MLKKIYKKDGKIIIENDKLINSLSFYHYLLENLDKSLDIVKKDYYKKKGFIY